MTSIKVRNKIMKRSVTKSLTRMGHSGGLRLKPRLEPSIRTYVGCNIPLYLIVFQKRTTKLTSLIFKVCITLIKDSGNCYLPKNTFTCRNVMKTELSKPLLQGMLLLSHFTASGLCRVNIAVFSLFHYSGLRGKNAVRDKSALPFTARSSTLAAGSLLRGHVPT